MQGEENSNSDPVEEAIKRVLVERRDVLEPKSPLAVSDKGVRVLKKRFRELLAAGHTLKAAETILHDVIEGARTHSDYAFSYMRRAHVLFGSERIGELCEFARSRRRSRELRDRALEERRLLRSGPTPRVESSVLEQAQINVVGALEALAVLNRAADDVDAVEVAANAGCAA